MTDPNDRTGAEPPELREYFRVLWQRKWTLLLVALLTVGAMLFFSLRQTPQYESEAKVLVPPPAQSVGSNGAIEFGKSEPEVEAEVATSEPVAAEVIRALNLETSPTQLLDHVKVTPLKNTSSVLIFDGHSPSPEQSKAIAHEFAVRYLQYRRDQYATGFRTELTSVTQQLASIAQRLKHASPEDRFALTEDKATLTQRRQQIALAIEQTKSTGGAILTDAFVPGQPYQPDHVRNVGVGLIIGLLLGVGAAFLRDYVDDRLRGADDVERQVSAPVLAAIPRFAPADGRRNKDRTMHPDPAQLVVLSGSRSGPVEAYRTLRTNLMFMAASGPLRRLLVTSPRQAEGKSTTASNLAVVFAQAGHRVLLIDADLRRPTIHALFGLSNDVGLSSVLSSQASLEDAVQNPGVPGLRVVTSGPNPPNPVELVSSPSMRKLIDQVADVTDWLIMDAPPVLGLADASALSSMADGVLLVVSQQTSRRELGHARDQLGKVDASLIGTVLNGFPGDVGGYYSRYYGDQDSEDGGRGRKGRRARRAAEEAAVPPAQIEPAEQAQEPSGTPAGATEDAGSQAVDDVTTNGAPASAPAAAEPLPAPPADPDADAQGEPAPGPPDEFFLSK